MRENLWRMFLTSSLLISMAVVLVGTGVGAAPQEPVVTVDPQTTTIGVDVNFDINVTVANVTDPDLYSFEINMTFNPEILNCTGVREGPFLKQFGSTWWLPVTINNYRGWVLCGNAFFPPPPSGATGSGTLAVVSFKTLAEGSTALGLSGTTGLATLNESGVAQPIESTATGGTVTVTAAPGHDVAVTDVVPSSASVTAGELVSIDVTVMNKGGFTETFNVTVLYDSTTIETKSATDLVPGGSATLSFNWDTEDVPEDSYTITAVASTLPDETETADNTHSEVVVTITAPSPATPVELWVAIIAAVAVCAGTLLYIRRRRSAKT